MGFLAITPSVNATTGEVTYSAAAPSNGVTITGVVLREFMTNGPNKLSDGTYTLQFGYFFFSSLGIADMIPQSPIP